MMPMVGEIVSAGEDALACIFANRHVETLRYVATFGKWFEWDGFRWRQDNTLRVFDLARSVAVNPDITTPSTLRPSSAWQRPTGGTPRLLSNGTPTRGC